MNKDFLTELNSVAAMSLMALLLSFLPFESARAQIIEPGYDFVLVPSAIYDYASEIGDSTGVNDSLSVYLYFQAYHQTCVDINIKGIDYNRKISIPKDSMHTLKLPGIPVFDADSISKFGVIVKSTAPISVYQGTETRNNLNSYSDINSSTIRPNKAFTTQGQQSFFTGMGSLAHWLQVYQGAGFKTYSFVLSLEDSNRLEIYNASWTIPLLNGNVNILKPAGSRDTVVLNQGDFFPVVNSGLQGGAWQQDFYARTLSNKAFKVISFAASHSVTFSINPLTIFNNLGYNAYVEGLSWEEPSPINDSDTLFFFPKFKGYQGMTVSLMAHEDSTQVSINGVLHYLNMYQRLDTSIAEDVVLKSNNPISAHGNSWPRITDGRLIENSNVGFLSVSISSADELIYKALVPSLSKDTLYNEILSLVTKTRDTNDLLINGSKPINGRFQTFTNDSSWSFINTEVQKGANIIESSAGFYGYSYVYRDYDSTLGVYDGSGNYGHVIPSYSRLQQDTFAIYLGTDRNQLMRINSFQDSIIDLCLGDTLFFSQGAFKNIDWQISSNTSGIITNDLGDGLFSIISSSLGSQTIHFKDSSFCAINDSIRLRVNAAVANDLAYQRVQVCEGEKINLWLRDSVSNAQYQWIFPNNVIKTGAATSLSLDQSYDSLRFTLITVVGKCKDSTDLALFLPGISIDTLLMPNILTPNGDGINDQWCFNQFTNFEQCFSIEIRTRWGELVFSSNDPNQCWKPNDLPSGVYYYILNYQGKQKQSFIHLN